MDIGLWPSQAYCSAVSPLSSRLSTSALPTRNCRIVTFRAASTDPGMRPRDGAESTNGGLHGAGNNGRCGASGYSPGPPMLRQIGSATGMDVAAGGNPRAAARQNLLAIRKSTARSELPLHASIRQVRGCVRVVASMWIPSASSAVRASMSPRAAATPIGGRGRADMFFPRFGIRRLTNRLHDCGCQSPKESRRITTGRSDSDSNF